jgi:hypothetical protein
MLRQDLKDSCYNWPCQCFDWQWCFSKLIKISLNASCLDNISGMWTTNVAIQKNSWMIASNHFKGGQALDSNTVTFGCCRSLPLGTRLDHFLNTLFSIHIKWPSLVKSMFDPWPPSRLWFENAREFNAAFQMVTFFRLGSCLIKMWVAFFMIKLTHIVWGTNIIKVVFIFVKKKLSFHGQILVAVRFKAEIYWGLFKHSFF